ncbi:hypothetical protein [Streptomyces tubercidicus]|uniref:hypothetical protein n=1 Tax=Streptomyces tubercidicus TaxID=47759 RepID=UPI0037A1C4D4
MSHCFRDGVDHCRVDERLVALDVDVRVGVEALGAFGDAITCAAYPEPGHLAVVVWGDPKVHIINMVTGREITTVRTGLDTAAIDFDSTGKHLAILRRGKNTELRQSNPLRKKTLDTPREPPL